MGSVQVNGAEVAIKTPTDGQVAALGRYSTILINANIESSAKMSAYLKLSDLLMKLVGEDDRETVEEALEDGSLTLQGIIEAAMKADSADSATTTVRRGRGRPRKSA